MDGPPSSPCRDDAIRRDSTVAASAGNLIGSARATVRPIAQYQLHRDWPLRSHVLHASDERRGRESERRGSACDNDTYT